MIDRPWRSMSGQPYASVFGPNLDNVDRWTPDLSERPWNDSDTEPARNKAAHHCKVGRLHHNMRHNTPVPQGSIDSIEERRSTPKRYQSRLTELRKVT